MIAKIEGKLIKLDMETALVKVGNITYQLMLPGYCVTALSGSVGSDVALCTMEYLEGTSSIQKMIISRELFKSYT